MTGLTAFNHGGDGKRVRLSWTAVTGATGYAGRWKSGNQTYGPERQVAAAPGATELVVTGLTTNTAYTFIVFATRDNAANGPDSSEVTHTPVAGDYDGDDDGLIEVADQAMLNAIRWDLDGNGTASPGNETSYSTAFPSANAGMGCPSTGCIGYELVNDIRISGDWTPLVVTVTSHPQDATWMTATPFNAIFEGNDYTISNLPQTLFGQVGHRPVYKRASQYTDGIYNEEVELTSAPDAAVVRNLKLDMNIDKTTAKANLHGGIDVQKSCGFNLNLFEDGDPAPVVNANFAGVAGVLGLGEIRNVLVTGDIKVTTDFEYDVNVGGIVGIIHGGRVVNSQSDADITIVHASQKTSAEYECYRVGGIAGSVEWGSITASRSRGAIRRDGNSGGNLPQGKIILLAGGIAGGLIQTYSAETATTNTGPHARYGCPQLYAFCRPKNDMLVRGSYSTTAILISGNDTDRTGGAENNKTDDYVYAGSVVGKMDGGLIEASYGGGVISVQGTVRHKYVGGIVGKKPNADSAVKNSYGVSDTASAYRLCEASATNNTCYDESLAAWKKTIDQLRTPTAYGTANTDIYKDWNIDTDLDLSTTYYLAIPTYNSANADDIWNFGTNIQAPVHGAKAGADPATQRANVNISQPSADIEIFESAAVGTSTTDIIVSINRAQRSPTFIMLAGDRDAYYIGTDQDNKQMEIPANSTAEHTFTLKAIDDKINQPGANRTVIRLRDIALPADMIGGTIPNVTITIKDDDLSPPTGVALSQLNNSRNMRIDWTAPTDPAPGSYIVKWNNQNGGWNSPLGTATPTANTYTVNNLTIGTTYYARVQAVKTEHENSAHGASAGMMLGNDYDTDDDGLIEISSLAQLNAMRWDLDGDGKSANGGYATAFPTAAPNMGCQDFQTSPANRVCEGYELRANLDFDTDGDGQADSGDTYWNNGDGWEPIGGTGGNAYTGDFDGNSDTDSSGDGGPYTISNLFIDRASGNYAGLFAYLNGGSGKLVQDVALINADVSLKSSTSSDVYAGGLAGRVGDGGVSIEDAHSTGRVRAGKSASDRMTFTANNKTAYVGGLFGYLDADLETGYSTAAASAYVGSGSNVAGSAARVGGLAGHVGSSGSVSATYAAGAVVADTATKNGGGAPFVAIGGGLVGYLDGNVTTSYARGAVSAKYDATDTSGITGKAHAGGLVGVQDADITASFSTGAPTATGDNTPTAGGLVANRTAGTTTNSYWDTQSSGVSATGQGTGKTTSELQTPTAYGTGSSIYANWDADVDGVSGNDDPWDFGTASQYPALKYDSHDTASQRNGLTIAVSPTTIWESNAGDSTRATSATITATLQRAWNRDVAVTLPADATAYTLSPAILTVPAGSTAATVALTAVNNYKCGTSDCPASKANKTVTITSATDDAWVPVTTATNPTVTINDDDELTKPAGLKLSVDGLLIRADWTAVTNATGYKVQWSTASDFASPSEGTVSSGDTTNFTIGTTTTLPANTRYYVRVLPTKTGADEPPSDAADTITRASAGTGDYDADNDGLIEIKTLAQLNAMRWDLNGDGAVDDSANATAYATAFPNAEDNMGCNETAASITSNNTGNEPCDGYELAASLDSIRERKTTEPTTPTTTPAPAGLPSATEPPPTPPNSTATTTAIPTRRATAVHTR